MGGLLQAQPPWSASPPKSSKAIETVIMGQATLVSTLEALKRTVALVSMHHVIHESKKCFRQQRKSRNAIAAIVKSAQSLSENEEEELGVRDPVLDLGEKQELGIEPARLCV